MSVKAHARMGVFPYVRCAFWTYRLEMVKTRGITFVVLATLLAGFVASCTSGDAPTPADLQSLEPHVQVVAED